MGSLLCSQPSNNMSISRETRSLSLSKNTKESDEKCTKKILGKITKDGKNTKNINNNSNKKLSNINTTPKSQNNIPRQKKQDNNKMEKDKELKKGHSRTTSNTAEESKLINCSCSSDEETSKLIDLSDDNGFDAGLTVTSTQKSEKQNETKKY